MCQRQMGKCRRRQWQVRCRKRQRQTRRCRLPLAPGGEESMWTRMQQLQTLQPPLQELVSSQRPAGLRTGLGTEGESLPGNSRAGWAHVRFVRAALGSEREAVSLSQAEDGLAQTTPPASQPSTAPLPPLPMPPPPPPPPSPAAPPPPPPSLSPPPPPPPPPPQPPPSTPRYHHYHRCDRHGRRHCRHCDAAEA